jgi:hypothetical protein
MSQIGDVFAKDIHRNINGVIKVGERDVDDIQQELEEYVITRETDRYFKQFFDSYVQSLQAPTDQIGVWISGFFGSGKSHFLKILSYLLANESIAGRTPLSYFEDKISDAMLFAAMQRAADVPSDIIMFNIDSQAAATGKTDKEAIVKVLMKVFNDHLGYFAGDLAIANFERQLAAKGKYDAFKRLFAEKYGADWQTERDTWTFAQDTIIEVLQEVLELSEASARKLVDNVEQEYAFSVSDFAGIIKTYLDGKSPKHRVVFMIDEVGQYIGSNSDLMLNLQTVSEDLGSVCRGQAWIMVTSQEDIDSVTQGKVKDYDFSKIQGRYKNRISLTSANTDEVIRLRLLKKDDQHHVPLEQLYTDNAITLENQLRFSSDTSELLGYRDAASFVASYPFVPYQFKLLQQVFTKVREMGMSGKHLAEGERSMLDAFQSAAKALSDKPLGALAPFHHFFAAIEGFLDSPIRRVFDNAKDNSRLDEFDVNLLKTLFMIRYVKGVPGDLENLTTFSIDHIGQDRLALEERVKAALQRLEHETLIQRSGNHYQFLTNEEQDVGRERKTSAYDPAPAEIVSGVQKILWDELYTVKEYKYDKRHSYPFNRRLDDVVHVRATAEIDLNVISSYGDHHVDLEQDSNALSRTGGQSEVLVRLKDDAAIFTEMAEVVRTNNYVSRKNAPGISSSLRNILQSLQEENRDRRERVRSMLAHAIEQADIFVSGTKLEHQTRSVSQVFEAGLEAFVQNTYNKLGNVRSTFESPDEVEAIWRDSSRAQTLEQEPANARAHSDMHTWLVERDRFNERVTMRQLIDHFKASPFGWADLDIAGVLAELVALGQVELEHPSGVNLQQRGLVKEMLSRSGLDKYSLRVPKTVDPRALKLARELAEDAFGAASVPHDPQALFSLYQDKLTAWQATLTGLQNRANAPDPYQQHFDDWQRLLSRLLAENRPAAFFERLRQSKDAFEDFAHEFERVNNFFAHQKPIFDAARGRYAKLEQDLRHITDESIRKQLEQAHAILTASDPSRDVPKLNALLEPVSEHVRALQAQASQDALQQWQTTISDVQQLADNQLADYWHSLEPSRDDLLKPLERLQHDISQASSIDAVLASRHQLNQVAAQVRQTIFDTVNRLAAQATEQAAKQATEQAAKQAELTPSEGQDTPPEPTPEPIRRQVVPLNLRTLAPKQPLTSEAELDAWLTSLREHLQQQLQDSDIYLE